MIQRKTVEDILKKKKKGERIVMLTAYDFALGTIVDEAGVDIVLVGDSLANVVLGLSKTKEVSMDEMIHHTKAVNRAVKQAMLVGDMPYAAYQKKNENFLAHARRFVKEAGAGAVKLEWFKDCPQVARKIVKAGIPVMGHVGLTPQTAKEFKVQGSDRLSAQKIIENAKALEAVGCFSLVLECVPDKLAQLITQNVSIPTIGIGSGVYCDGQVLVIHDVLGFFDSFRPKFVKPYADVRGVSMQAVKKFCADVREGKFPDDAHSYHMKEEEFKALKF